MSVGGVWECIADRSGRSECKANLTPSLRRVMEYKNTLTPKIKSDTPHYEGTSSWPWPHYEVTAVSPHDILAHINHYTRYSILQASQSILIHVSEPSYTMLRICTSMTDFRYVTLTLYLHSVDEKLFYHYKCKKNRSKNLIIKQN